ncbi:MAG: histidine kinase dimerization/phospho-acceptor domain-containing protein, partial [Myxococcota bacterium]
IDDNALLHLHCHQPTREQTLHEARDRCVEVLSSLTGHSVDEDTITMDITGERVLFDHSAGAAGLFTHVPIHVGNKMVGVLMVETQRPLAQTHEKQMYFLASRAAETTRRLSARRNDERRRLSLMVESMADGLVFADTTNDHILINPSARGMLGLNSDQRVTRHSLKKALGFHPRDLISARTPSATEVIREELRIGGRSLHSIISSVRDRGGKLVGVVMVLRDITDATDLAERQSQFMSVISHELRSPLTSISGAIDILLSDVAGKITTRQRGYLKMARNSCNQLNSVVENLIDAARGESGDNISIHFRPIDLGDLGREAVERFRGEAESKRIHLRVTGDKRPLRIIGDPGLLHQVLSNLLSNAVKFTPEDGEIEVE